MAETTMEPAPPPWTGNPTAEELEQRLQRLEDVVASLCDTQGLEDRVRDRVVEQLRAEIEVLKAERPAPAADDQPAQKPRSSAELPPVAALARPTPPTPEPTRSLLREFSWELRTLFQMVRDPIYRFSWPARLVLVLPAVYILWSSVFTFPENIPLIGPTLDFILNFAICYATAYVVFKVFGRELRRYRDFTARNPW